MGILTAIDWTAIVKIAVLDLTLSVNNAAVIAPQSAALHGSSRWRAIAFATVGAALARATMLLVVNIALGLPLLRVLTGAYLLWAGYRLLAANRALVGRVTRRPSVPGAAFGIVLSDLTLSIDNVIAVAAAAHQLPVHGTVYAIVGVCVSIPLVMFGAGLLAAFITPFPFVMWLGAGLLGWVGVEIALSDPLLSSLGNMTGGAIPGIALPIPEILGFLLVVASAMASRKRPASSRPTGLSGDSPSSD
ncbi:TerC family protein [Paraburkholderia sp. SIMBA_054]|uniref:TerC family protein n=1 Tax=Paraburkholderia sp. SIMBA_054 TaxID=3085795 RepID=UPI00397D7DDE